MNRAIAQLRHLYAQMTGMGWGTSECAHGILGPVIEALEKSQPQTCPACFAAVRFVEAPGPAALAVLARDQVHIETCLNQVKK